MVNSGSFDSATERNERGEFTYSNHVAESPQSAQGVSGSLCENDFTTQTADSLPISQAIEPTATKTEYKCNISESPPPPTLERQDIFKSNSDLQVINDDDRECNLGGDFVNSKGRAILLGAEVNIKNSKIDVSKTSCKNSNKNSNQNSICCSVPLEKVKTILNMCGSNNSTQSRLIIGTERQKQIPKKDMCLYCDRTFVTPSLKQKHVDRFHSLKHNRRLSTRRQAIKQSITACMFCEKLNNTECSLRGLFEHLVLEHSKKYFGCLDCEIRFPNVTILESHRIKMHRNINDCVVVKSEPPLLFKETYDLSENVAIEKALDDENEFSVPETKTQFVIGTLNKNDAATTKNTNKYKLLKCNNEKITATGTQERRNSLTLTTTTLPVTTLGPIDINAHSDDEFRLFNDDDDGKTSIKDKFKANCVKELRSKKISVIASKSGIKQCIRITRQQTKIVDNIKPKKRKPKAEKNDNSNSRNHFYTSFNSYATFDGSFRVKKITDHSIDNLKINSLTFDDVFDKAFFGRVKCNIQENLLNYVDGKLFKSEESESRISSFQKSKELQVEETTQSVVSATILPTTHATITSQSTEETESQAEVKPFKKKTAVKDEVHYKYFTRRKYQAAISKTKEHPDLSKLDMWTQLAVKNRQQKILTDKKTDKEMLEYAASDEYKIKMRVEELDKILDKRGPVEDLKEEAIRNVTLEKWNGSSSVSKNMDSYFDVTVILNDLISGLFSTKSIVSNVKTEKNPNCDLTKEDSNLKMYPEGDVFQDMLNLRRLPRPLELDVIKEKDQETDAVVELTGEWARSRIYVCAACGIKVPNTKFLIDHQNIFHEHVWCQHNEFVGNQRELYKHLSIPGLGKVGAIEENSENKLWRKSDARLCSKCNKQFNCLGDLHRHILECGGDWSWMLARKKYKYRPYGSKPRKKRRGLLKFLHTFRERNNCQSREKRKTIKKFDGPRQKPSDADSIERMLANLPAKRITRKVICLKDGLQRTLKNKINLKNSSTNKQLKQQKKQVNKSLNNEKHGNGKVPVRLLRSNSKGTYENHLKVKNRENNKENCKINSSTIRRHSVRNINKILANNIVKTNKVLMKRKIVNAKRTSNNKNDIQTDLTKVSDVIEKRNDSTNILLRESKTQRKRIVTNKSTNGETELKESISPKEFINYFKTPNNFKPTFLVKHLPQGRKIKEEPEHQELKIVPHTKCNNKQKAEDSKSTVSPLNKRLKNPRNADKDRDKLQQPKNDNNKKNKNPNIKSGCDIIKEPLRKIVNSKLKNSTQNEITTRNLRKRTKNVLNSAKTAIRNLKQVSKRKLKHRITKIVQVDGSSQNKSTRTEFEDTELIQNSNNTNYDVTDPPTSINPHQLIRYVPRFIISKTEVQEENHITRNGTNFEMYKYNKPNFTPNPFFDQKPPETPPATTTTPQDNPNETLSNTNENSNLKEHLTTSLEEANIQEEKKSNCTSITNSTTLKRKLKKQRDLNDCIAMLTNKLNQSNNQSIESCPVLETLNLQQANRQPDEDLCSLNECKQSETPSSSSSDQVNPSTNPVLNSSCTEDAEEPNTNVTSLNIELSSLVNDENCEQPINLDSDTTKDVESISKESDAFSVQQNKNVNLQNIEDMCSSLFPHENPFEFEKQSIKLDLPPTNALKTVDNIKYECVTPNSNTNCLKTTDMHQLQESVLKRKRGRPPKSTRNAANDLFKRKYKKFFSIDSTKLDEILSSTEGCNKTLDNIVVTTTTNNNKETEAAVKLNISDDLSNSGKENVIVKKKTKRRRHTSEIIKKCDPKITADDDNPEIVTKQLEIPNVLQDLVKTFDVNKEATDSEDDIPLSQFITKHKKTGNDSGFVDAPEEKAPCKQDENIISESQNLLNCFNVVQGDTDALTDSTTTESPKKAARNVVKKKKKVRPMRGNKKNLKKPSGDELLDKPKENTQSNPENFVNPPLNATSVTPLAVVVLEERSEAKENEANKEEDEIFMKTDNELLKNTDESNKCVNDSIDLTDVNCASLQEKPASYIATNEETSMIDAQQDDDTNITKPAIILNNEIPLLDDVKEIETPQKYRTNRKNKTTKIRKNSKPKSTNNINNNVFCDICNKTFSRSENLLKHKRTLTHIAKLSELEALEADNMRKLNVKETELLCVNEETNVWHDNIPTNDNSVTLDETNDDVVCIQSPSNSFNLTSSNDSLKLVDIINDVLSKPINDDKYRHSSFSGFILSANTEMKRCKSLGERKSFDSDNLMNSNTSSSDIDLNAGFDVSKMQSTANIIVEKQISLLENMIEDNFKGTEKTFNSASHHPLNEDYSNHSNSSGFSLLSACKQEECNEISFTHNTNIITNLIKPTLDEDHLIPSVHYEEISEDSTSSHFQFEEHTSRKVLNRDEELFLECCSLLKSSSDISDICKKTTKESNFHENMKPLEKFECCTQKLIPKRNLNDYVSENTIIGQTFSNNSYSNSEFVPLLNKSACRNDVFSQPPVFEDISTESEHSNNSSNNEPLNFDYPLSFQQNQALNSIKLEDRDSPTVESAQIPEHFRKIIDLRDAEEKNTRPIDDGKISKDPKLNHNTNPIALSSVTESNSATIVKKEKKDNSNKQLLTKGAMKTFEGLKVSIPKEGLDMKEVLSCSPTSKRLEIEAKEKCMMNLSKQPLWEVPMKLNVNVKKATVVDKSASIKKDSFKQCGNKLGFKITKKRKAPLKQQNFKHLINSEKKSHDVYDFEETQDNVDVFSDDFTSMQTYHSFKNKLSDKINNLNENIECKMSPKCNNDLTKQLDRHNVNIKSQNVEDKSDDVSSMTTLKSPTEKKVNSHNIVTKKKCMIMDRIFKNALKTKIEDDINTLPTVENSKIVEDYVMNCSNHISYEHKATNENRKLTEEEMNVLFDSLLNEGNTEIIHADSEKDKSSSVGDFRPPALSDSSLKKTTTRRTKLRGNKNRKKHRGNSSSSSDEEFSIKKISKKSYNRKNSNKKKDDNCGINLEQELKECIGVASRKSQRKCTSGKQNVLVEYWSSDESNFDNEIYVTENETLTVVNNESIENKVMYYTSQSLENNSVDYVINEEKKWEDDDNLDILISNKICEESNYKVEENKCIPDEQSLKGSDNDDDDEKINDDKDFDACSSTSEIVNSQTLASGRQKRTAVDTLYYWSSSSDDELQEVIEVKPLREDYDDEDRPLQHGWIVGDSPKKLVTMLAQAKGKRIDAECVKKNKKKRTTT